jgi:hypothetical protein
MMTRNFSVVSALMMFACLIGVGTAGANLITNGSFDGNRDGWTWNDVEYYSLANHTAGQTEGSIRIYNSFGKTRNDYIYQIVPVAANTDYTINFWAKADNSASGGSYVEQVCDVYAAGGSGADLMTETGTDSDFTCRYYLSSSANGWTEIVKKFNSGDNTSVMFRLGRATYGGAADNYNDMTVDDVNIAAVPEPATLSLIGIGLLGGFIRRNRK